MMAAIRVRGLAHHRPKSYRPARGLASQGPCQNKCSHGRAATRYEDTVVSRAIREKSGKRARQAVGQILKRREGTERRTP